MKRIWPYLFGISIFITAVIASIKIIYEHKEGIETKEKVLGLIQESKLYNKWIGINNDRYSFEFTCISSLGIL